jgi:biotin operon repressor
LRFGFLESFFKLQTISTIMDGKEIRRWLKDTNVRVWKRILFLLSEEEELGVTVIGSVLGRSRQQMWKLLKKLELSNAVKNENKKWHLTDRGNRQVHHQQKIGAIPKTDRQLRWEAKHQN